jgi:hypothetical protein
VQQAQRVTKVTKEKKAKREILVTKVKKEKKVT